MNYPYNKLRPGHLSSLCKSGDGSGVLLLDSTTCCHSNENSGETVTQCGGFWRVSRQRPREGPLCPFAPYG